MKITGIINSSLSQINRFKYSKASDDISVRSFTSASDDFRYSGNSLYYNDRGSLSERDNMLAKEISATVSDLLELLVSPKKNIKNRLLTYNKLLDAPENMVVVKVNNPQVTALSGEIKNIRGENYFDFNIYGYFNDRRRFLINEDGEIIKSISADYVSGVKGAKEPVYYSQHEINNLDLKRYLTMYKHEIGGLKEHLLSKAPVNKSVPQVAEPVIDPYFIREQKETIDSIQKKFNKIYNGIINNTRTAVQRRKLCDVCDVRLYKNNLVMQVDNINKNNDSAVINFTKMGSKSAMRVIVLTPDLKIEHLFVDGQLVKEYPSERRNPFIVGRIEKYFTPDEMQELKADELLNNIDRKLSSDLSNLRGFLGSARVDE